MNSIINNIVNKRTKKAKEYSMGNPDYLKILCYDVASKAASELGIKSKTAPKLSEFYVAKDSFANIEYRTDSYRIFFYIELETDLTKVAASIEAVVPYGTEYEPDDFEDGYLRYPEIRDAFHDPQGMYEAKIDTEDSGKQEVFPIDTPAEDFIETMVENICDQVKQYFQRNTEYFFNLTIPDPD